MKILMPMISLVLFLGFNANADVKSDLLDCQNKRGTFITEYDRTNCMSHVYASFLGSVTQRGPVVNVILGCRDLSMNDHPGMAKGIADIFTGNVENFDNKVVQSCYLRSADFLLANSQVADSIQKRAQLLLQICTVDVDNQISKKDVLTRKWKCLHSPMTSIGTKSNFEIALSQLKYQCEMQATMNRDSEQSAADSFFNQTTSCMVLGLSKLATE